MIVPARIHPDRLRRALAGILFVLLSACGIAAAVPTRVDVTWAPDKDLTEIRNNPMHRGWLRPDDWKQELAKELRRHAERVLPPGERLEVHIDDIKLAGDFEPWHRPGSEDIRIMKEIYPPRIDLHYKLLASDGRVIRESDAKLRDMAYLQRAVTNTTDPLRYDKRLIDEWLRKEFGEKRS